jgi:hypothetical protein
MGFGKSCQGPSVTSFWSPHFLSSRPTWVLWGKWLFGLRPSWQSQDNSGSLDNAYSEAEGMSLHSIPFSVSILASTYSLFALFTGRCQLSPIPRHRFFSPTSVPLPPCFLFLSVPLSGSEEGAILGQPHLNKLGFKDPRRLQAGSPAPYLFQALLLPCQP